MYCIVSKLADHLAISMYCIVSKLADHLTISMYCIVSKGWSLLPDALRSFKTYCAPPSITSQLVLFLWQTVEIVPLGHVRVVEVLQNFVRKCDPVALSGIRIYIAGVQQFNCR